MKANKPRPFIKTALAAVSGAFILDAASFMYASSGANKNIYSDRTFIWAWVIFAMIIVALFLYKLPIRPGPFIFMIVTGTILYSTLWHPLFETNNLLKPNYVGIVPLGFTEPLDHAKPVRREELSFLFAADDPDLETSLENMRSERRAFKVKKFLFWQTGIGYGFGQRGLPSFYERGGYRFYRLALVATVGPVVLAECLISGLIKAAAIILLIQWGWFFLRKRHLLIR